MAKQEPAVKGEGVNLKVEPEVNLEKDSKVEPEVKTTTSTTNNSKSKQFLKVTSKEVCLGHGLVVGSMRTTARPTVIQTGVSIECPEKGIVLVGMTDIIAKHSRLRVIYPTFLTESTDNLEVVVENVGIDNVSLRKDVPVIKCTMIELA